MLMTDMQGREVLEGDVVLYTKGGGRYAADIELHRVVKVTDKSIMLAKSRRWKPDAKSFRAQRSVLILYRDNLPFPSAPLSEQNCIEVIEDADL